MPRFAATESESCWTSRRRAGTKRCRSWDGLLLETLLCADEIREAEPLFSAVEDDPEDKDLLALSFAARTNALAGRIDQAPVAA